MVWRVRRVVTGHDTAGKSILLMDGLAPNIKEMASMPGLALTDLWETTGAPASNAGNADNADRPVRLEPPQNGTILRIVEFPPDAAWRGRTDGRAGFDSIGAGHAQDAHSSDPMMHKTASVDYIIVLKGEIHAIMEKGETLLKPGDILIQRGTNHSWSVRGNEPCIVAAVLVSAAPVGTQRRVRKKATTRPAKRAARPRRRASAAPTAAARKRGTRGRR
jgi:mannose-6-phosphate isomerase-like protein (cupin superfamily)